MQISQSASDLTFSRWFKNESDLNRQYPTLWFLLPLGSIFTTALVVLLMILFNRCPQMIAAVVTGILGIIIIVIVLLSLDHRPVYH